MMPGDKSYFKGQFFGSFKAYSRFLQNIYLKFWRASKPFCFSPVMNRLFWCNPKCAVHDHNPLKECFPVLCLNVSCGHTFVSYTMS